jgi:hypothetical protein
MRSVRLRIVFREQIQPPDCARPAPSLTSRGRCVRSRQRSRATGGDRGYDRAQPSLHRCPGQARTSRCGACAPGLTQSPCLKVNPAPSTSSRFSGTPLASTQMAAPIASSNARDRPCSGSDGRTKSMARVKIVESRHRARARTQRTPGEEIPVPHLRQIGNFDARRAGARCSQPRAAEWLPGSS